MSLFDVARFQEKYGVPRNRKPGFLDDENMRFRLNFMLEELNELAEATGFEFHGDIKVGFVKDTSGRSNHLESLADALDALIDLEYVLLGTAIMMGFYAPPPVATSKRGTIWGEAWQRVHEANMKKVRAVVATDSKRGSTFDVIKPKGWTAPTFGDLLQ